MDDNEVIAIPNCQFAANSPFHLVVRSRQPIVIASLNFYQFISLFSYVYILKSLAEVEAHCNICNLE